MYVMLNARPEQLAWPKHSFTPVLSIVSISTTPGALAVPRVQAPSTPTLLMHLIEDDGCAMRGPKTAAVGLRTVLSVFT